MSEENDKHDRRWRAVALMTILFMLICAGLFASRSCQEMNAARPPQTNGS